MIRHFLCILGLMVWGQGALAQGRDASRVYVFGNSLVNHLAEVDHTNVPHWVNEMAKASDQSFAVDGQWGFLRNFADGLPPTANWSFDGVRGAWPGGGFSNGRFDAVIVTPANFIQYQQPDVPFDGDNTTGESPFGATLRVFDWVADQTPDARLFVYEGWAEMATVTGAFPPDAAGLAQYQSYNAGAYHDWYVDLIDRLNTADPSLQVRLLPVASILADLLGQDGPLAEVPATALYADSDPHGTPSLYFLAAMITYAALYDAPPPAGYRPPGTLHPEIVAQYPQLAERIWQAMPDTPDATEPPTRTTQAGAADPLPERQPLSLPPSGVRPDGIPALGMGLNGVADWSTQYPFIDLMKTARDWVGHLPGQWGGVTAEELRAAGHLDENGWPISIPDGVDRLESVLLTDQPEDATYLRGAYVVLYEGSGNIKLTGRARRVQYGPGQIRFSYEPGEGLVGISLDDIPAQNPIRNIRILREDHLPLHEVGVLFNPAWIERVRDLRSVRFMDWMLTNGSPVTSWADRPRLTDATWTAWGVPLEVMIQLSNQIGADPWFNMPHLADDDYVRRFAQMVEADLDPRLKAYVEFSNEVWNFVFPQAQWAAANANARWGDSDTGWMQFYALRAAQVMDIWSDVYGDAAAERLTRVAATHTGWPGLETDILEAPLAFLELGRFPVDSFDAYAITGYFGYEMGGPEMAERMNEWLDRSEQAAEAQGQSQGLRRVALREFVKGKRFDGAIAPVTLALEEGSLRELVTEIFPYQASAARAHGLQLVMYEGGTHVTAHGEQVNDQRLTDFFTAYNYTPEMAKLYEILLSGWVAAGGTLFNAFVDVAPATQWGSWGGLRHLGDRNPRWDMLMAYNASAPNGWEARDLNAFRDGVTQFAGSGNQRLQGTSHEDILIAGSGDDTLVSSGGSDFLHGGPGRDRVVLPGVQADYSARREGRVQILTSQYGTQRLFGIETLVFDTDPSREVPLTDLAPE